MRQKRKETQSEAANQFNLRAFGTDVLTYSIGNGLLLLFGFIQILIIPKYLSIEGYGYWQLFMLYTAYVGILHLGFIDGLLVRWAGNDLNQIGTEIGPAFKFLLLQQLITIIPLCLILYFFFASHQPFEWIALMILAYAFVNNLVAFFQCTAQAIKKFKLLTAINVGRGLVFLILIILLFISGYLDYHNVIFAFLTAALLALFVLAFWFRKDLPSLSHSSFPLFAYGRQNIGIGIFVLLGNFISVLFLTIDRLMVSSFFPIEQFAIYAFAMTIAAIAYTFVVAVSAVFFPYLSGAALELRARAYHLGKPAIILAWAAFLAIYFPMVWLIRFYLPPYTASLPIMQLLFCMVGFGSLIQILHANYYKVYRKQRRYFVCGITALALAAILNLLAIKVWGTLESVAISTLVGFGVWYIINELSLRSVVEESKRGLWKGIMIICGYIGAFWVSSLVTDWLAVQMFVYACFFFGITWLFLRDEVKELVAVANVTRGQRQ
jgi:O-antigen/teichoic acid export membrane protein